jgi:hypothetical protein
MKEWIKGDEVTGKMAKTNIFYICVREIAYSNLGWDTDYM